MNFFFLIVRSINDKRPRRDRQNLPQLSKLYTFIGPPGGIPGACLLLYHTRLLNTNIFSRKKITDAWSRQPRCEAILLVCVLYQGTDMRIEQFLSLLEKVKKNTSGWTARCPAHDDRINSLSIGVGRDDRILIKCFAGCSGEEILKALNLTWSDLFSESYKDRFPQFRQTSRPRITFEDLAFDKGFSVEFLESLGVEEQDNAIRISYYLEDGSLASRQRKRWALSAKEGSCWEKGQGKPVPYGLWKLKEAKKDGVLFLVEGESDSWTLWWHNYHALGIPGADMAQKIQAEYISGIQKIYIVKESDQGGETFVKGIRKRLEKLQYKGILFVVEMGSVKDPNALHQRSSNFKEDFGKLLEQAKPLSVVESELVVSYGNLIPELPAPVNKTVQQLMQEAVTKRANFAILAPQGSGKSYANAAIAVSELKKGRSVIILSRSHDELNQLGQTIRSFLIEAGIPEYHLFHLKGAQRESERKDFGNKIPEVRPIIVIAPHIYFQFKGDTPYHHTLANMIFQGEFGKYSLVLIDEFVSYLESTFISKPLGSRNSLKKVFGEELWVRNMLCPLFTRSGNCLNCISNKFLQPRRVRGGMLEYMPIFQYHKEDHLKNETVELDQIVNWDIGFDDNTMWVYQIIPPKAFADRQWSTGGKDDLQLQISLKFWLDDILSRLILPAMIYFYPYDSETRINIGHCLSEIELEQKKKGRRIVPPRTVCGVPILLGWDLAVLRRINGIAQIGLTGPSASEADRYLLHQAIGEIHYYSAQFPYVRFDNLLIITIEKDIFFDERDTQSLIRSWTETTKVLSFLPTYYEAKIANQAISEKVRTMYYDGDQKIRHAPIEGTSIKFDLCISCIHGPLGQGLDLGQFNIVTVCTSCERPKHLFVGKPGVKTNTEYILDDVAEKSRQAALRILRLTENEPSTAPRIFFFYGRNAVEVGQRVKRELTNVGHTVKIINAQSSLRYAQEVSLRWLQGTSIAELESVGVAKFEEERILGGAKSAIQEYIKEHPDADWREVAAGPRIIRELPDVYKRPIKKWFQEQTSATKQQDKLQQLADKIQEYRKKNPQAQWSEIRRKFNLDRKTEEIKERIRQLFDL